MKSTYLSITALLMSFSSLLPATELPKKYHQCKKILLYNVFFHGAKIGTFERQINWQNNNVNVYTYSNIDVLVTKSSLKQHSSYKWSAEKNSFISQSFDRDVKGLISGKFTAKFSDNASKSSVDSNGKIMTFSDDSMPLLDADALASQMRLNVINGEKKFDFLLQDADEVNHYYFEVKGQETINTNFGKLKAIRVEQTRKSDRKLYLWFAPDLDYQLVLGTYKRKILDLKTTLNSKKVVCPPVKVVSKPFIPQTQ
ncbi:DUF3108 domain-containing protein [Photobacterium frigidiphilum]|uniref:DUF3108 domain-containing protein n=1 Tax=Photobacterium frigidiphilum TaxID=264736 RepID=UPI003D0B2203